VAREVPGLSVVIPVYNEPHWTRVAVDSAAEALGRSPFSPREIVIVDDGSDAETQAALAALEAPVPLRVVRQENAGRFAARRTGIEAARNPLVLLLDARVTIGRDGLAFVASQIDPDESLPAWFAHMEIETKGNLYASFWNVLSHWAFRDYYVEPRTLRYGLEEYDRMPKGTGCFLAPRAALLAALADFDTHFTDTRHANDDTLLIRPIAASQGINVSPGLPALYRSRTSFVPFLRHSHHRGIHFFDGFGRPGTRFSSFVLAFFPASLVALLVAARRPRLALAALALSPAPAALGARLLRRPWAESLSFAVLVPPFTLVYAAGIWRGGLLALRARLARGSKSTSDT
jgi:glycosyltransferase involved in cell wall biosynthesis